MKTTFDRFFPACGPVKSTKKRRTIRWVAGLVKVGILLGCSTPVNQNPREISGVWFEEFDFYFSVDFFISLIYQKVQVGLVEILSDQGEFDGTCLLYTSDAADE